jgi:hypothetical protein
MTCPVLTSRPLAPNCTEPYFLLPGHRRAEGEEILNKNGRFEVVRKT